MLEHTRLAHSLPEAITGRKAERAAGTASSPPVSNPAVPSFAELPDLLLIERSRGGDPRAFDTLMRRYNQRLYRIARSILSVEEHAEEAVRAAYFRAFANLDCDEPAGKIGAWLARLTFNEALALRRRSASVASAAVEQSTPVAADDGSQPVFSRQQVEAAIDALPEVFRTVLVLRVLEALSGVEVAVCLGLNETTARTRLYRAQHRLRAGMAASLRARALNVFELTPERCDRIVAQVFAKLHAAAPPAP